MIIIIIMRRRNTHTPAGSQLTVYKGTPVVGSTVTLLIWKDTTTTTTTLAFANNHTAHKH